MSSVAVAAMAVFPYLYKDEAHRAAVRAGTAVPGPAIEGLEVTLPARNSTALWHASTGLYGFTGLLDGPHLLHLVDRQRRLVPRTLAASPSSREATLRAARRGAAEPPTTPRPLIVAVPMRPGHQYPFAAGETVFRGTVTQLLGGIRRPAPFARVEVHREGALTHVLHADDTGRFALWLRGEVTPLTGATPPVSFRAQLRRRPAPADADVLGRQPGDFDTLSSADLATHYGPLSSLHTLPVTVGTQDRLTLNL